MIVYSPLIVKMGDLNVSMSDFGSKSLIIGHACTDGNPFKLEEHQNESSLWNEKSFPYIHFLYRYYPQSIWPRTLVRNV